MNLWMLFDEIMSVASPTLDACTYRRDSHTHVCCMWMPHTHVCSRSIQILCTLHACMLMFRTFAQEHPCAQSMILCISNARAYFTHLAVLFQRMDVSIQRIMTHAFYTIMLKKYESCTCTQRVDTHTSIDTTTFNIYHRRVEQHVHT